MNAPQSTSVKLRLPSRLGYEKIAMGTVAAMASLMGFSESRIEDLKTAVAEACINAIEHGNRMNEGRPVGVELSAEEDSLEVKILDEGKGLHGRFAKSHSESIREQAGPVHREIKNHLGQPNIERKMHGEEDPRGMGIFLIRSLVDEAEWVASVNGKSSYVRLVIHLRKDVPAVCVNEMSSGSSQS